MGVGCVEGGGVADSNTYKVKKKKQENKDTLMIFRASAPCRPFETDCKYRFCSENRLQAK